MRLLGHWWTRWSTPEESRAVFGTSVYQHRTCRRCGKMKRRYVG